MILKSFHSVKNDSQLKELPHIARVIFNLNYLVKEPQGKTLDLLPLASVIIVIEQQTL